MYMMLTWQIFSLKESTHEKGVLNPLKKKIQIKKNKWLKQLLLGIISFRGFFGPSQIPLIESILKWRNIGDGIKLSLAMSNIHNLLEQSTSSKKDIARN